MNVLILQGNPNKKSFNAQLAKRYKKSAEKAGHSVEFFHIIDINFDYNLTPVKKLEKSLVRQQELIAWADHVVITTPVWWMGFPAGLKAYFDRVFTAGFAFDYPHSNVIMKPFMPKPLLKGKSLRLIATQDAYAGLYWLIGNPFALAFRFGLFSYVGFKYRRTALTRVRWANDTKREAWLNKIDNLAKKAK